MTRQFGAGGFTGQPPAGRELGMRFAEQGLLLGEGTILVEADVVSKSEAVDCEEPRLVALLAAAHLRVPSAHEMAHLKKASQRWAEGEDALASVHLALSGLSRLQDPKGDAHRLVVADALIGAGCAPTSIVAVLGLTPPARWPLAKYDPDEPRVPAGSGRTSGQWTTGGSATTGSEHATHSDRRSAVGVDATQHNANDVATTSTAARTFTLGAEGSLGRISVELPSAFTPAATTNFGPFGDAVKAMADQVEITDSISKWRELGPRGELAVEEAVKSWGWEVVGRQIYVRTTLGLRVEDLLVSIPSGVFGNSEPYLGFVEVKVNGGRYSPLQEAKDALIYSQGGILLTPVATFKAGQTVKLGTGLANVTITYVPKESL